MLIQDVCNQAVDTIDRSLNNFNFSDPKKYANFLAQTYYYVSHSTRMLAFSAGLMGSEYNHFFRRFIHHISEESGHEALAKKDLENLDFPLSSFPQLSSTRMLWETQYYKIQHENPLSLMGYILALEVFSAKSFPSLLKKLVPIYGDKCVKFVRVHAEEDPDHITKAFEVVKDLPETILDKVKINAIQTGDAYAFMLNSISAIEQ